MATPLTQLDPPPSHAFAPPLPLLLRLTIPLAGLLIALLLAHAPMISTHFLYTQSDPADGRLNNYFLENAWRWLTLTSPSSNFWDPPFYYPQTNVASYSDLMLSFTPLYIPWRAMRLAPDTAMQCWMLCATAANFLTAYLFLRRCISTIPIASAAGAILFSAAAPRVSQMLHAQLLCAAFPLLALYALYTLFKSEPENLPTSTRRWLISLLAASLALQFWGSFYNAFFLMLALAVALLFAILTITGRRRIVSLLGLDKTFLLAIAITTIAIILPALIPYLAVRAQQGSRSYDEVAQGLMKPWAWVYPGPFDIAYGFLTDRLGTDGNVESATGCGLLTTAVAIAGLYLNRRRPGLPVLIVCTISIIALVTIFFGRFSLWWFIYRYVPGAGVIRVPARICLLLLLPISVGFALALDHLSRRRLTWLAAILAIACLAEQSVHGLAFLKSDDRQRVASIAAAVPPAAVCFYYDGPGDYAEIPQLDAMWASLISNVPTINGYSGCAPPDYPLTDADSTAQSAPKDLFASITAWTTQRGLDPASVAWIAASDDGTLKVTRLSSAAEKLAMPLYPEMPMDQRFYFNTAQVDPYLGAGWSVPEKDFRWTDGQQCEIHFSFGSPPKQDAVLSLAAQPFLTPALLAQRVVIRLNNHIVRELRLTDDQVTIQMPLPHRWLARDNTILLQLPDATSSPIDSRRLSFAAVWMSMSLVP